MSIFLWVILGLLYLAAAAYLYYERYVLHPRTRYHGMIAFSDKQANILTAIWPITFLLFVLFVVVSRFHLWRDDRQQRKQK